MTSSLFIFVPVLEFAWHKVLFVLGVCIAPICRKITFLSIRTGNYYPCILWWFTHFQIPLTHHVQFFFSLILLKVASVTVITQRIWVSVQLGISLSFSVCVFPSKGWVYQHAIYVKSFCNPLNHKLPSFVGTDVRSQSWCERGACVALLRCWWSSLEARNTVCLVTLDSSRLF